MPRDGSGIYTTPPGTTAVPDTTIESSKYNGNVADVAADLNAARPIVAGGTGATSAAGALTALGAVAKAGDTMTGNLEMTKNSPQVILNKSAGGQVAQFVGTLNGLTRWTVVAGDDTAETGFNVGGDFVIRRWNDVGAYLSAALNINRATGNVTVSSATASTSPTTGALTVAGGLGVAGVIWSTNIQMDGAVNFRSGGLQKNSVYNNGSALIISTNIAATTGVYLPDNTGAWAAISDERLAYKKSARDITDTLPSLDTFRLYERTDGHEEIFVKAQEVAEMFPHIVIRGSDDPHHVPEGISDAAAWKMSYDRLGAVALAYIKQLTVRVSELEYQLKEKK